MDGTKTLAVVWPTTLTYCSGDIQNLETELLIGLDNLAHSIQHALNVNNIRDIDRPELVTVEYQAVESAHEQCSDNVADDMPHMRELFPLFQEEVLYKYKSTDEEARK